MSLIINSKWWYTRYIILMQLTLIWNTILITYLRLYSMTVHSVDCNQRNRLIVQLCWSTAMFCVPHQIPKTSLGHHLDNIYRHME